MGQKDSANTQREVNETKIDMIKRNQWQYISIDHGESFWEKAFLQ